MRRQRSSNRKSPHRHHRHSKHKNSRHSKHKAKRRRHQKKYSFGWILALILAIIVSILTDMYPFYLSGFVSFIFWIISGFKSFKVLFKKVNRTEIMHSDLGNWGFRLLGGLISGVALFILIFFTFASGLAYAMGGTSTNFVSGIIIYLIGAVLLGLFMTFRSNRRYGSFVFLR